MVQQIWLSHDSLELSVVWSVIEQGVASGCGSGQWGYRGDGSGVNVAIDRARGDSRWLKGLADSKGWSSATGSNYGSVAGVKLNF